MTSVAVPQTTLLHAWQPVLRFGLLGGVVAVYLCLVGIVPTFNERPLIEGVVSSARPRSCSRRSPPATSRPPAPRPTGGASRSLPGRSRAAWADRSSPCWSWSGRPWISGPCSSMRRRTSTTP